MTNEYFTPPADPVEKTRVRASKIADIIDSIDAGFDNLPAGLTDTSAEVVAARDGESSLLAKEQAQDAAILSAQGGTSSLVSSADTTNGFLNDKINLIGGLKTITNPGANEVLTLTVGSTIDQRTSNTILDATDVGSLIDITSGTFSQTFTAAATLGSTWWCYIRNSGTGNITLDPYGTETIDGLTSFIMYPGEARLVQCNGTAFFSIVLSGFTVAYSSGATAFTKPPGYTNFEVELWGAGGGGGSGAKNTAGAGAGGGGGGGGAYKIKKFAASAVGTTETVTIGAGGTGGAAQSTNTTAGSIGTVGGNTSFGTLLVAYGGGYGSRGNSGGVALGGGGGGSLSAGNGSIGGGPYDGSETSTTSPNSSRSFGGAHGPQTTGHAGAASGFGGGSGGMGVSNYIAGTAGGCSAYGGSGGGGGAGNAAADSAGGAGGSQAGVYGGGGAGGVATTETIPPDQTALGLGGGGGYYRNTATAGNSAGAAGGIASGGGGGAAGLNSIFDSGAGGSGGDGYAVITGGTQ